MKAIEPKRQFLASTDATKFAEAINAPIMRQGIEVALQQFVLNQLPTADLNAAAVSAIALEGAKRYISILLNLIEPETSPKPDTSGQLLWQSKHQSPPSPIRPRAQKRPPPQP